MEKREKGYMESVNALNKMDNMTEEQIISKAKEILRVISLDRKQLEDRYIITRKKFADVVMQTMMNPEYHPTKNQRENDKAEIMLKYIAYIREESKLDYNRRLLQMIK